MLARPLMYTLVAISLTTFARADDKEDDEILAKQKAAVAAAIKKLELKNVAEVDTKHFHLVATIAPDKLKALSEVAEKYYAASIPLLKFDANESPWKGKLALYLFSERSQFTNFVRSIENRRPEGEDVKASDLRTETPHLALILPEGKESTPTIEVATGVAEIILKAKAGPTASVPTWMRHGFSRAVQWKLEPNLRASERAQAKKLLAYTGQNAIKIGDLTSEDRDIKERRVLGASMMEYLMVGPYAAKFSNALAALRPSEENQMPSFASVIGALSTKEKDRDAEFINEWRSWMLKGK